MKQHKPAQYLRQVATGRIYIRTDALAARADMQLMSVSETKRLLAQGAIEPPEHAMSETVPKESDNSSDGSGSHYHDLEADSSQSEAEDGPVALSVRPVSRMTKDELAEYADAVFGVALDTTKPLLDLRKEVQAMAREGAEG